ncbi:MAG: hypothetical protein HY303_04985, partial [Candidatus Wallbacteria bacterium]|nr:hypothetical protein [Candidatus Wallbacteria bacterium]
MRLPLLLLLLPAVLALSSCGREEEIVVKFEDSRPPSPPSSAPSVPTPQPTPVPPTPAKPPQKPPVAVVKPPPGRYPHAVAIFCEAPFFPSVAVTFTPTGTTTGTAPIHDLASRDGFGAAGKLGLLPPGEYTLVLNSS